jgi:hypothetical protein
VCFSREKLGVVGKSLTHRAATLHSRLAIGGPWGLRQPVAGVGFKFGAAVQRASPRPKENAMSHASVGSFSSPAAGSPEQLRAALVRAAEANRATPSTPALNFGAYVRKEVDATPETAAGVLAMRKFLRLDPAGKAIEKLEREVAAAKADMSRLERRDRKVDAPKDGRKKDVCQALAKLMKKVLQELKDGGLAMTDVREALIQKLKSKSPAELSRMLKEKLGIKISGRTIGKKNSRGEYESGTVAEWSQYRSIPGVRLPSKPLPGAGNEIDKNSDEDPRRRAADKSRIDANEAVDGVNEIVKGNLRQTTRICSGYGRLRTRRGDDPSERQMDGEGDAILNRAKQDPLKVEFRPIAGRPPASGKDRD